MSYSEETVIRARERLAQAKADREAENREHLEYAYQKVPRIRDIDRQLRISMATAAQRIFSTGANVQESMEEVKRENLALQRERALLAATYFEEGYLDDSPICPYCSGTGYVGTQMCECLQELCRQEQKKEISAISYGKENFNQFKLSYYSDSVDNKLGVSPRAVMEKTLQKCQNYANGFSRDSENLLFNGDAGLGKTFLSLCIAKSAAERGYSVRYESAPHLMENLQKSKFKDDENLNADMAKVAECDLLVIDDLGTEYPSQMVNTLLYTLINDRLMEHRPTIISTNLNMEQIQSRYTPQIASRLRGSYTRLLFLGEDIRIQKSRF